MSTITHTRADIEYTVKLDTQEFALFLLVQV
jgi:hypothetical protein